MLMSVTVLICALATAPNQKDCTVANARVALQDVGTVDGYSACAQYGIKYVLQNDLADIDKEYVKVRCAPKGSIQTDGNVG